MTKYPVKEKSSFPPEVLAWMKKGYNYRNAVELAKKGKKK